MTAAPVDNANSPTRARVIKRTDYTPGEGYQLAMTERRAFGGVLGR